jgi:hypothetical protein
MMQTDVLATHLNADGVVAAYPVRVKGYQIKPGGTAGQIDFYDNVSAASGTIRLSLDITTNTAVISTIIPGEGIRFNNGVFVDLPTDAAITVFYG